MHYTNIVCIMNLGTRISLRTLALNNKNVIYKPSKFSGLIWKHPKIRVNCLVFATGKIVLNGPVTANEARSAMRKYARLVQKTGYPVKPSGFKVVTRSAVHMLEGAVSYERIVNILDGQHQPEIFHPVTIRREGIILSYSSPARF